MMVLRVNDIPLGRGQRRVEVTWQDGPARRMAVSSFAYQANEQDDEQIRWYLEDYAELSADSAPAQAAEAEARLSEIGTGLFQKLFTAPDAARIWELAQAHLGQVRVEVDTDPADAPGLPWELLRDPGTGSPLAVGADTFVRTHLQTARQVSLPEAAGDTLRVLLVICRPAGRDDVPFRSVASRLVRGGAARMDGLHLDVLRPATYPRLAQVLHEAADAGRPYHVVHFDGHGLYLDVAGRMPAGMAAMHLQAPVTSQLRPGHHGYLIFEDPASRENLQLTDGPTLGRLLTATGVPVLLLNACRSAYTEAPSRPGQPGSPATGQDAPGGQEEDTELADVHARIRAYGSLAAEVADAGVPGVVAMRYNVYVVTAAQYALNLYAHLLAGAPLGHAATAARRALADNPIRQIGATPVTLQDWVVPIVYEAAPLTLFQRERQAPVIRLDLAEPGGARASATDVLPRPPDAGFFGRDETLLALDRALDTQRTVLLHGDAGAGKTATVAEFARWYRATGGLYHPVLGSGPVFWSSFEHHLPLDRLLDTVGDCFSAVLEDSGIHWQAVTSQAGRRDLVLQILAQVPVLWVWDNVDSVTGFPPGTPSAWNAGEQEEIAGFLRDLAQQTRCKVLLTSRRDEQAWLAQLPARVLLPPMPMRERLQLAYAIVTRNGHTDPGTDWRPLLRYTAGNPLAITVLVGQAVRDNLTTTEKIKAFVARLRAGEQELEDADDAALRRTSS